MSRLQKDSTIPSVASTSQEDQESRTLKVTLLSSEWKSSTDGDLSTINRELAIQLAKLPNVDVSVLLPNCSGEDRSSAESHNVKLIEADKTPGVEPVLCLSSPPINHTMDCVIGHGVHLGRLIPLIKKNPNYSHCKWIQVVHSALEEDGMYKNISEGEKMQKTEIKLCKMADQVITIGPKLAEDYKHHLRRDKQEKKVLNLTPGIFSEFLEVEQATEERRTFCILVIGSGDSCEDFNVKGYDIAAKAIAKLKDESYKLKFVCPAGGKGNIVAEKLLHHGISRSQLIVRSFDDSREVLADLFCEVDLAIIPSRTEGFGITALEALSTGLPVLVSANSGLGQALKEVPFGSQSVVDSEDPRNWAKKIKHVRQKEREVRLSESRFLREEYLKKYSWEEPCKSLVIKMRNLVFGGSEQVICNLQQCQQNAGRCKISSNTDRLSDLKEIASGKGYRISDNVGSGNCMFYALSEQLETVKGVKINHFELRRFLVQYLREHPKNVHGTDLFCFVDGHATWGCYLTVMEQDATWGDHVILWAAANCYQIAIHVISNLPGRSEVIINPDCPFDQSKHLVLGHVHEVHYVSLQPLQGSSQIKASIPGKDKRKASVSADQPHKRLREELTNRDYCEDNARHSLNNHGQDHFPGATPTHRELVSQISGAQDHELAVLRRLLSAEYNRRSLLKPLFWLNTIKLALDDVYTRLSIVSRRKTDFVLEGNEVDMFNIFRTLNKGEDAMVLVEGSPGIGKTTFCLKISHDWAKGTIPNESSFPLFELVLLLKCRDFHGDVMEAIVNQLLPEDMDQNAKKNVVHYIKDIHNQERILIILDGLDELPKTAERSVDKLLHRRILPFCSVLATSRQEKGIEVRLNVDFDVLLQIKGFTEADSYDYIRKHFRHLGKDYEPKGGRLIKAIQENSYLHELPSNPLNLLLLCVVFECYEGNLPSCRTDLYQIIVICLLRRYCAKHNLKVTAGAADGAADDSDVVSDKALMRHFEDSFLVLGELAWRCLKEDRFSFREEELVEFESTHKSLAARKLGLVFKEASLRKINPQHEYFFFHKTFQEYLAAFYLAHMLLKQMVDFSELNFYEDLVERYRQVFVFMSGILGGEAGVLFEQIGKKLKDENWDWYKCSEEEATFFHECFSESRNYEQVAMALCSFIPFPQTVTIDLSDEETEISFFIILNACKGFSELHLPVHLEIVNATEDNFVIPKNGQVLDDFLSYCTRLQTLSFSVWNFTHEIPTLLCKVLRLVSTAYSFTLETNCCISSDKVAAISDSLVANKSLTTVTFKVLCGILKDYVTILDKGLSADTPLTSVVFKIFGSWTETETEHLRKILLNRSLTSLSLTVEDMHDSLATSVSKGLVANPSLKSLVVIVCGKLSYSGLSLLKEGLLRNKSLESLQLKVFGELPTNWANICGTLQSTMKSTTSFTVYPIVTGMVGNSQVAFLCPFLKENLFASKLNSLTVNIWGELDCSGATDLCKLVRASSVSCVNLNLNGIITDSIADCLFKHFDKLNTLSNLSIDIRGEVMGDGKNSLQRLSCNQVYLFALNVHSSNSSNKICRGVCLTADHSSSLIPVFTKVKDSCVTKLSVSMNNPGSISEEWKCNLFEGVAKNECLTTLNLEFSNSYSLTIENMDALWEAVEENATLTTVNLTFNNCHDTGEDLTFGLGDGLGKNTSLTTLSLTVNNYSDMVGDLTFGVGDGLGKNTSLTTLSLTVNNYGDIERNLAFGVGDGLGKNTSLTTLSLTVNNYSDMEGDLTFGLDFGLGKNTSLTTLSLTVNNYSNMEGDLTYGLGLGLRDNTSLTTLSLTVNNYGNMEGDLKSILDYGLGQNTSLTTLSLTVNSYSHMEGDLTGHLGDGLGENTSLTTLSLTVNNYSHMKGDLTYGLSYGLRENTSLTTLSLTVNNYSDMKGYLIGRLGYGLGKNTSLTTLSLTVNNYSKIRGSLTGGLGNGLGKNTSLTMLSLTVNNYGNMEGDLTFGLGYGLGKNTLLTTLSLTVNNYSEMRVKWAHYRTDGLEKNTSVVTLNLTLSNWNNLYEDWIHGLVDALVTNMSSTAISLEVNIFGEGNEKCESILA